MEFLLLGNQTLPMGEFRHCCSRGAQTRPHLAASVWLQQQQQQREAEENPDWIGTREGMEPSLNAYFKMNINLLL